MTVPAPFVLRSYGGGAQAAQLVEPMGVSDLSFGITTTVGWTEADGNPLGTAGDFTVIIDRFTDTVEKITCSSVNLTTGIVTVPAGGRGADDTTPQAHVPNGSIAGVQTCWTSVEAAEANKAVNALLGGSPSNNEVLTWVSGAPAYVAPAAGLAAYAQITSPVTGLTTLTTISGLSVAVTLAGGQTPKVTAYTYQIAATGGALATDQYSLGIYEGSTLLNGAVCVAGNQCTAIWVPPTPPSTGTHTYFVQANHVSGSTPGVLGAAATQPAFILAEVS